MNILKLTEKDLIDPVKEVHLAFHNALTGTAQPHCHDFFEFFLVYEGSIVHHVNGTQLVLNENTLVFIRPDDVHFYEKLDEQECKFINMAFLQKSFAAMMDYLGDGFSTDHFLKPVLPPLITLTNTQKDHLRMGMEELNLIPVFQKNTIRTKLRALLAEIFTRCFDNTYDFKKESMPDWMENLCSTVARKKLFIQGLSELIRISNISHEHLCRLFKKYLNKTPTEFINEHRLNYAANLLINTDKDILSICLDVGFSNLSHFCHVFKERFHISPREYRKINKKPVFPIK